MVGISQQGDRWCLELTVDSATMSRDTCRSRADRSTLIKAQLSALNVATHKRDIGYDGGYTLQPVCARPAVKARS